ncbi:MAG: hypothetical protein CMO74_14535 [Verrucomicrobiales bacterium]|nr:hypothetical protein [Verrucomicrobiales bacterium]|tara:strand:+ start:44800 stop:45261 length:462 start_codon:yes stop_codon:yes gene_type:complete
MSTKKTNKKRAASSKGKPARGVKPAKRAKATKAAKKPELKDLNQTTGKTYEQNLEYVKKLEEILEVRKSNPYGTNDARIFEENMAGMSLTELQEVAVRAGVFPSGNRTILKNKLTKAFKSENLGTNVVIDNGPPFELDPNNPKHKKLIEILEE